MLSIYDELTAFSNNETSLYIDSNVINNKILNSFRNSLAASLGQVTSLAVEPYAVRFDSAVIGVVGQPATDMIPEIIQIGRDVVVAATDEVVLNFTLGFFDLAGTFQEGLTSFTFKLVHLQFTLTADATALTSAPGEAQVTPKISRDPKFEQTLLKNGLDKDTATRVEGMLYYSGIASALNKLFADPVSISLADLFPGLQLSGKVELGVSTDKRNLFLRARGGIIRREEPCLCTDAENGIGPIAAGKTKYDREPAPGGPVGIIQLGGPTAVKPTDVIDGPRGKGEGFAGALLPNDFLKATLKGPFPGVRIDLSDNGFIGWKAAGFVDFDRVPEFKFDPDMGRFFVTIFFRAEVYGSLHIDLGKLGKIRVTEFSAEQSGPGADHIEIGFYLVLGAKGLYLKPVIEEVVFGDFEVNLRLGTLVGTPFGVWGAVYGFIFDKILDYVIASQIPNKLDLEIRKYVAKMIFTIIDIGSLGDLLKRQRKEFAARYTGGAEGMLASVYINKDQGGLGT